MKDFCSKILFLLILGSFQPCFAQQPAQYSLYMLNPYNFNVAYAGLDESLSVTGVFRKQWVALDGSPITQDFNAHLPWYFLSGGLGLDVENDILGAERNTRVSFSYNYVRELRKSAFFSVGMGGGILQKSLDGTKLRAPEGTYQSGTINHNDDLLPLTKVSGIAPTLNFGVYYKSKTIEAGFSANNLIPASFTYETTNNTVNIDQVRSYFFIFAYDFEVGNRFAVKPSVFVKSDAIQTQAELSAVLKYNEKIFGGSSLRGYNNNTIDAVVFLAGMHVTDNITVAYSYDLSLSPLKVVNKGSHEIMINYNLRKEIGGSVPTKVIYNPRFY